jgi:hypothetical protein
VAFLFDTVLAICNQPKWYWQGHYDAALEPTLFFQGLYVTHPVAAIAGYIAWAAVVASLLLLLPELLSVILAIVIVFGHICGAYSQLIPVLGSGWYQVANSMFMTTAAALGSGLYWYFRTSPPACLLKHGKLLPIWLRWSLIAALLGTGGFMIWVPSRG